MKDICRKCHLVLNVMNQVNSEGGSNPRILFLYDHPSKTQDTKNGIFVGRNFSKLKTILDDINLYDYTHHSFILKCRPTFSEIHHYQKLEFDGKRCSSIHLAEDFKTLNNSIDVIVPVGLYAFRYITNLRYVKYDDYKSVINKPINLDNYILVPILPIGELIKANALDKTIKIIKSIYARNFNIKLLFQ